SSSFWDWPHWCCCARTLGGARCPTFLGPTAHPEDVRRRTMLARVPPPVPSQFDTRSIIMLIKRPDPIHSSEITPRERYLNRRQFMRAGAALSAAAGLTASGVWLPTVEAATKLTDLRKSPLSTTGEELTPYKDVTTYNNYYEFGTGKDDPSETAHK